MEDKLEKHRMAETVLVPTILCGGSGSRLWPVSREQHPKPLIRINGGSSLLQKAFLRGATLPNVSDVLTVANREQFFKIEDEYREVAHEPESRLATALFLSHLVVIRPLLLLLRAYRLWSSMERMQFCSFWRQTI